MVKNIQPAKKSYFFGKGYRDLKNTIKGAWQRNFAAIKYCREQIVIYEISLSRIPFIAFRIMLNFMGMLSVFLFGSLITLAITLLNIVILFVFMFLIYVGFTLIWIVDTIYLIQKRIFTACHECKEKMLIPTYICPQCRKKHTNLTPGAYGILKRTCVCGYKLPTTFFGKVNDLRRRDLNAICPFCGHSLRDRETVPICIPVVGGRSVGKTAFITAFSYDFIQKVAPAKGWAIESYSEAKSDIYQEMLRDYNQGSTRMTDRPQDVDKTSSVSFSFFIKSAQLRPERLVHIYDIAGEVFTDNSENEIQKQYEYCQGIVLIIDPFAIPRVRYQGEKQLTPEDIAGIGRADINSIINSFLNKLREVTGFTERKMYSVPLAVVISKIDAAGLSLKLGQRAIDTLMAKDPFKYNNVQDVQDYLCRKFLLDNGMESFLSSVNIKFKNNRYFACTAIGHARDQGKYQPEGVMPPMEWLFRNADSKMAKLWNDHDFTKKPFGRTMKKEELINV